MYYKKVEMFLFLYGEKDRIRREKKRKHVQKREGCFASKRRY